MTTTIKAYNTDVWPKTEEWKGVVVTLSSSQWFKRLCAIIDQYHIDEHLDEFVPYPHCRPMHQCFGCETCEGDGYLTITVADHHAVEAAAKLRAAGMEVEIGVLQ